MKIVKLTMEHVQKGTEMINLPIYFVGNEKECRGVMKRFKWQKDENLMGGYWVDEDLDCYYLIP
jgi:hypothetical protein